MSHFSKKCRTKKRKIKRNFNARNPGNYPAELILIVLLAFCTVLNTAKNDIGILQQHILTKCGG